MMENEMVVEDVPEEVIQEILLRLPVKSLLKFRCVSKSWLSLISSHQFATAHLNISSKKNDTLIFGSTDKISLYTCSVSSVSELTTDILYPLEDENPVYDELDCPFNGIAEYRSIVGSCNGLVCLSFKVNGIILWNPALKKFKKLPYSGTSFSYRICHGFGYDKVHDDYKVVEVYRGSNNSQVKVYSRRSNSWKVLGNWPGGFASCWPGQFLKEAIHWSVCRSVRRSPHWFIVAQDVASDEFVELPLPNFKDNKFSFFEVEILDGCVALCCGYGCYMDVWMMKEYGLGESWVKQLCIPFFEDLHPFLDQHPQPLLFLRDGKILLQHGTTLKIYDSTNPQPLLTMEAEFEEAEVTTYFESLVSPNLDEDDCGSTTSKVI